MERIEERYRAVMVLSAAGDAIGYRHGRWEFQPSGISMYEELQEVTKNTGISKLCVTKKDWPVSDDTLLHMATAMALNDRGTNEDKMLLYTRLAKNYSEKMLSKDMRHRAPGNTCMQAGRYLESALRNKNYPLINSFDERGGGSGAAMRSMCIGLVYSTDKLKRELVEVSIEAGRLTHHHPTGYLGSLASALFTSYAIKDKPIREWGKGLMDTLEEALAYIISSDIAVQENLNAMSFFKKKWMKYLDTRGIADGKSEPSFPKSYGIYERDNFYRSLSYDGTGGASGHDSPMIAYDALLGSGKDWEELCMRAIFHGGDSDTTGVIAGALYGALYGFEGVPKVNYEQLEFHKDLDKMGKALFELADKVNKAHIKTESLTDK